MKNYAALEVFKPEELDLLARATRLVEKIPDDFPSDRWTLLRCHEVARAIGIELGLEVVDGHHGRVEHSWLLTGFGWRRVDILDVYAVGRLPAVQLVDMQHFGTGHSELYKAGEPRKDICQVTVDQILSFIRDGG